jgi:hypothetical protein
MNRGMAIQFQSCILAAFEKLFEGMEEIRPHVPKEVFHAFATKTVEATTDLDLNILEVIYRAHPDLRGDDPPAIEPTRP